MILDHVSQAAALFIITGAGTHAAILGHSNLHAFDEVSVPQRLENLVGEPHCQDVLDGFLAQVVVDAKDLVFVEHVYKFVVQFACRVEAATERFFDDDSL